MRFSAKKVLGIEKPRDDIQFILDCANIRNSRIISAIIMIANIGWSVAIIAVVIVLLLLMYRFMILIVFAPGIFACALHPILEKVFRKYMSAEDIAKEDEDLHY